MVPICCTQTLKAWHTHAGVTCPWDCWARSIGLGNSHWAVAGGVSSWERRGRPGRAGFAGGGGGGRLPGQDEFCGAGGDRQSSTQPSRFVVVVDEIVLAVYDLDATDAEAD